MNQVGRTQRVSSCLLFFKFLPVTLFVFCTTLPTWSISSLQTPMKTLKPFPVALKNSWWKHLQHLAFTFYWHYFNCSWLCLRECHGEAESARVHQLRITKKNKPISWGVAFYSTTGNNPISIRRHKWTDFCSTVNRNPCTQPALLIIGSVPETCK